MSAARLAPERTKALTSSAIKNAGAMPAFCFPGLALKF
jgi:hypothetical protein